jgi:large subunit ribosomal protein L25
MKVELRTEKLSEIRKRNLVPGVMYGKSIDSTNIQVDKQELLQALDTYGKTMTFKIRVDNKYHHVYIKNVQSRIIKPKDILHVDLHRVTPKETFTSQIPIEIINHDKFLNKQTYIEIVLNEVTAEYSPGHGLQAITIDVEKLELGDKILVKDLNIPKGMTLKHEDDELILMVKEAKIVEEEPADTTEESIEATTEDIDTPEVV